MNGIAPSINPLLHASLSISFVTLTILRKYQLARNYCPNKHKKTPPQDVQILQDVLHCHVPCLRALRLPTIYKIAQCWKRFSENWSYYYSSGNATFLIDKQNTIISKGLGLYSKSWTKSWILDWSFWSFRFFKAFLVYIPTESFSVRILYWSWFGHYVYLWWHPVGKCPHVL